MIEHRGESQATVKDQGLLRGLLVGERHGGFLVAQLMVCSISNWFSDETLTEQTGENLHNVF